MGFYSNRTDFIRTAIRNQLERHADAVKGSVAHKSLDLGLRHYSCEDLEAVRSAGQKLQIHVLGLASIGHDLTPELACATIESVVVLGALRASPAVKAALADRVRARTAGRRLADALGAPLPTPSDSANDGLNRGSDQLPRGRLTSCRTKPRKLRT